MYALLPLPAMSRAIITRLNENHLTEKVSSANPSRHHFFPFNELPVLKSHIYPHFAIFNLMSKVNRLYDPETLLLLSEYKDFLQTHENALELFDLCQKLYMRWMVSVPDSFLKSRADPNGPEKASQKEVVQKSLSSRKRPSASRKDEGSRVATSLKTSNVGPRTRSITSSSGKPVGTLSAVEESGNLDKGRSQLD